MRVEQRGRIVQSNSRANREREELVGETKPYHIDKKCVLEAFKEVKRNHGTHGVDGESIEAFEADLRGNLYKIWNRMSSGTYFPPPVRRVEIPKKDGGKRPLGIPTVADRVAQSVARKYVESEVEGVFHEDSYAYQRRKSALDAVAKARERCFQKPFVIDLDIVGFFDNVDHGLVMKALRHHKVPSWVLLYVERWLKAPVQHRDGRLERRTKGTPQGGVMSPFLANLLLHYAFDAWMSRTFPTTQFERYADDIVIHCSSSTEAKDVLAAVRGRLMECGLALHPEKTKIVYCQQSNRREKHDHVSFDFLGFTFRPRTVETRYGLLSLGFTPAISSAAAKKFRSRITSWGLTSTRLGSSLEDFAQWMDPIVRGWFSYYGRFTPSLCRRVLQTINEQLVKWACKKYRRFRRRRRQVRRWLLRIAEQHGHLLYLWRQLDVKPAAGR